MMCIVTADVYCERHSKHIRKFHVNIANILMLKQFEGIETWRIRAQWVSQIMNTINTKKPRYSHIVY
jgi:hypothetical protein